jgi:hypothetical protein
MASERQIIGPRQGEGMDDHMNLQKHRGHVARVKSCLGMVSDKTRKKIATWCIEMENGDLTDGVPWDTLHTIVAAFPEDEAILTKESLAFNEYVQKVRNEHIVDLGSKSIAPQSAISGISAATQSQVVGRSNSGLHGLYAAVARRSSGAPAAKKASGSDK